MGLFKPIWMTSNYKKCEKAVKNVQEISDQDVLCQIALQAPQSPVREAAIDRITDQKILAKVYTESNDGFDCSRALEHLSDQSVLKEILYSDIADYSKSKVVEMLTGRDDLREAAERFNDRQVYYEALKKLYDIYKNQIGITNVELKIYEGMRHELQQEIGRERVYEDQYAWIRKVINGAG